MWDLIVLGEIPGTQIQVSFTDWLIVILVLSVILVVLLVIRQARYSKLVAAWHIRRILLTSAYLPLLISRRHMQA